MPSSGAYLAPRLSIEDSFLELLADTLESLDLPARGQFLQRYFRAITRLDLRESQCLQLWEESLQRRNELTEHLARAVSLKTALLDVLASAGLLRVPVLIEYEELKKLQHNAVTDPLTGLYNRRLFNESFEKELTRAKRYGQQLAVVMLDLHRFKEVNDKHGHMKGDEVLRAAAATLNKSLRTSDFAFRIGGDEFALLLPQTDPAQAMALSRRVETVFAEMLPPLQLSVGVSMDHGVATFPIDGEYADQLVRVADERLYRLKDANRRRAPNGTVEAPTDTSAASAPVAQPDRPAGLGRTIPIESKRPAAAPESVIPAPTPIPAAAAKEAVSSTPKLFTQQRKAERVSMAGTNAYAMLGEGGALRARVIDLGFGGVALELESRESLPASVLAILHVPILPPVRVNLRPVWYLRTLEGLMRVGCCFTS